MHYSCWSSEISTSGWAAAQFWNIDKHWYCYAGRPVPTSKWTKNNKPLPADDNLSMSQKPEMCKLQIQKARRMDAGEYELELENASGKVNVPITIKVIGKLFIVVEVVHCFSC